MKKITNQDLLESLGGVSDRHVLDALPPSWQSGAAPTKRTTGSRLAEFFLDNGWVAAIGSVVVALGVIIAIVMAGRGVSPTPPAGGISGEGETKNVEQNTSDAREIWIVKDGKSTFTISGMPESALQTLSDRIEATTGAKLDMIADTWIIDASCISLYYTADVGERGYRISATFGEGDFQDCGFIFIEAYSSEGFQNAFNRFFADATFEDGGMMIPNGYKVTEVIGQIVSETETTVAPDSCQHIQSRPYIYINENFHDIKCSRCGTTWRAQHDWQEVRAEDGSVIHRCTLCYGSKEEDALLKIKLHSPSLGIKTIPLTDGYTLSNVMIDPSTSETIGYGNGSGAASQLDKLAEELCKSATLLPTDCTEVELILLNDSATLTRVQIYDADLKLIYDDEEVDLTKEIWRAGSTFYVIFTLSEHNKWGGADVHQIVEYPICFTREYAHETVPDDEWLDREAAEFDAAKNQATMVIEAIYVGYFLAYDIDAPEMKIKINGTLMPYFRVGDEADVHYQNTYIDWETNRMECELITARPLEAPEKPVIYLYPEEEMEVSVKLTVDGKLTCTYPAYGDGWQVTASPDGTLRDADGKTYYCLYWEGVSYTEWDWSRGFCVRGEDSAAFLEDALARLGLTPREANEFIIYWLPRMEKNPYNIIAFQTDVYTDAAVLDIDPAPDTLIRVFMTFRASDTYVEMEPQVLTAPEREGFVAVEWGGAEG